MAEDNNSSSDNVSALCRKPYYVPTVQEYSEALGAYGVAFISTGSVVTVLLILLFVQQLWFTMKTAHKAYRRHIYWIISVWPFAVLMSFLALLIPRAQPVCHAFQTIYMTIGIGHFIDLTLAMYGSENKMAYELRDDKIRLNVLPVCCVLFFLPQPPVTKQRIRFTKWMVWQMKWVQCFFYLAYYLSYYGFQDSQGRLGNSHGVFTWLIVLNVVSFVAGVYAITILNTISFQRMKHFRYRGKAVAIKLMIMSIKLQSFILDILYNNDVFSCIDPVITPLVYKDTLKNSLIICEGLLCGVFTWFMYRLPEFMNYQGPVLPPAANTVDQKLQQHLADQITGSQQKTDVSSNSSGESAYSSAGSNSITNKSEVFV